LSKRWRIGAVSYLNTRPFLLGIEQSGLIEQIDLVKAYPSQLAQSLIDDTIDIGLVPVAIIPLLKEPYFISDFCIGAEQEVASVAIFSDVPMDQIEKVYLDHQSRTSVQLARLMMKLYWEKEVEWVEADPDYIEKIGGTTAGVIIGDRALAAQNRFAYMYDLATAWKKYTGLPFVFATWVSNKPIPDDFKKQFDAANAFGLNHIDEVIAGIGQEEMIYDLKKYYTENISYTFTEEKKKGLDLFLKLLARP
jgi:chorismate dehydratase